MPTVTEEITKTPIDRLAALQEIDRKLKDRRDRMTALVSEADGYELAIARQRELVTSLTTERDTLEQRRATMDRQLEVAGGATRAVRTRRSRGPIAQSGQSRRLITGRSQVRILVGPFA